MQRAQLAGGLSGLVVGLVALALYWSETTGPVDRFFHDASTALIALVRTGRDPTTEVAEIGPVVLAIDERADRMGRPPDATRDLVARALAALHRFGPCVVAVDVFMTTPAHLGARDGALEEAIRRYPPGRIVLASKFSRRPGQRHSVERPPLDRFRAAGARWGFVDVPEEPDQVLRRLWMAGEAWREEDDPAADATPARRAPVVAEHLALAAVRALRPSWGQPTWAGDGWEGTIDTTGRYSIPTDPVRRTLIPFPGPPGQLAVVELSDLLELDEALASGASPPWLADRRHKLGAMLSGRLVVLGAAHPDSKDAHLTPVARLLGTSVVDEGGSVLVRDFEALGHRVYGAEIVALCVGALLAAGPGHPRGGFDRPASGMEVLGVVLATGLAMGWLSERLSMGVWLALAAGAGLAGAAGAFLLHLCLGLRFPGATVVTLVVLLSVARVWMRSVREAARQEFLKRTLARYVSREIMQAILADPGLLRLPARRVDVTVLFCDLRGFTTLAWGLPPAAALRVVDRFLEAMATVVLAHGGVINKFLGDGLMAFWGAPLAEPDHATKACRAGLAMQERLAALATDLGREGIGPLAMGVGINSGEAVVGTVGFEERLEYTLVGDVVNVAARLQELTKRYGTGLLVGEPTARATGERLPLRRLDRVRVRGRQEALLVYEVAPDGQADLEAYAAGLAAYLEGRFDPAVIQFERALARWPQDPAARLLLTRSRHLVGTPPTPPWDGCYPET